MPSDRPPIVCACGCDQTGPHQARGLIGTCYQRERTAGRLDQWPSHTLTPDRVADLGIPVPIRGHHVARAERIADYIELRDQGVPQQQAGARLGVSDRTTTRWHHDLRAAGATHRWLYDLPPHTLARTTHHQEEKALAA
jgi:hypothetical protein